MGASDCQRAKFALLQALNDKEPEVREAAARWLEKIHEEDALNNTVPK
ncbi:hypothetical protein FJZ31_00910 [Candidatus Poribacteria bacterium]|nr:hypothetical protein [Candidatus Poribacteria bacterium]